MTVQQLRHDLHSNIKNVAQRKVDRAAGHGDRKNTEAQIACRERVPSQKDKHVSPIQCNKFRLDSHHGIKIKARYRINRAAENWGRKLKKLSLLVESIREVEQSVERNSGGHPVCLMWEEQIAKAPALPRSQTGTVRITCFCANHSGIKVKVL